jgi:hypothetical protein
MDTYSIFQQTKRQRISDGSVVPILDGCDRSKKLLVIICPQLGDFDSLEYAWWFQRERTEPEAGGELAIDHPVKNSVNLPNFRLNGYLSMNKQSCIHSSISIQAWQLNYLVFHQPKMLG